MAGWEVLLIPLIALGLWIVSAIFRGAAGAAKNERPGQVGQQEAQRALRRPASDLDRFLEETRRRKAAQAPPAAPATAEPVAARPQPLPRPAPPRPAAPVPQARPAQSAERRPTPKREARPAEVPVQRRQANEPAMVPPPAPATVAVVTPVQAVPVSLPTASGQVRAAGQPRAANPFLVQLAALLNKKESIRAAIVLREVLDRPLCDRRR